ncbi:kinesin-like protein KIN-UC isoform X2 [Hevea brasiliensis]|uniref:kinesin-like protein KIN-UC isoform X2 n=1 Tax=Hevea brasiliensis TaxID=3981 RepID=UPI0025FB6AB0|nr:kinesin-like protein KIN-UC isoform X2 [Hevea brasiliensis]
MASNSTGRTTSLSSHRADRHQQQQQQQLPSSLGSSSASSSSNSSSRNVTQQNPNHHSLRSKAPASSRRSVTPTSRSYSSHNDDDNDPGRVRVAVRLRPRNAEELILDSDFSDCVELQPELRRLKLRKNNWSSESYKFDEIFTENASQKRVYEAVAKPVVEGVLNGYNGTVMAYGQTGTGKTYTVGRLGKNDASERGIMVRALEDILANANPASDIVEVSYLQLYMESIQDLLAPEKINIPINEDPRTGDVSLPGAMVVRVRDLDHFFELLQIGEANRHAANTKQNTESSRSHAILMVYVRRSIHQKLDEINSQDMTTDLAGGNGIPRVRKSKLLIVDLAGSERLDKSGSEGRLLEETKFINLSLTSLGKCINALAENCPHIPTRDSKLTRLLRDSFGGSSRTSLIITIGPSSQHHAETTSTIMFGQRAMKIVNMLKLKEEFDYESLCRKLEIQVDHLTVEIERERKLRESEKYDLEKQLKECQDSFAQTMKNLVTRSEFLEKENSQLELEMKDILNELDHQKGQNDLMHGKIEQLDMSLKHSQQLENSTNQKVLADTTQMYEKKISDLNRQLEDKHAHCESSEEQLNLMMKLLNDGQRSIKQHEAENSTYQKALADTTQMYEKKMAELNKQLEDEHAHTRSVEEQLDMTKKLLSDSQKLNQQREVENSMYQKALAETTQLYEKKIADLVNQLEDEHAHFEGVEEQLDLAKKLLRDQQDAIKDLEGIEELRGKLQEMYQLHEITQTELQSLKSDNNELLHEKATLNEEVSDLKRRLSVEIKQRKSIEHELAKLKTSEPESDNKFEDKQSYMKEKVGKGSHKSNPSREILSGQRATIAKICEEVGLQKILQLLMSEDSDVQTHAVKVIANLAAEDINQEKIVEEGGLDALLMLLKSSQNATILRVASGAIANLAMNEMNQGLIMSKGGARLLAVTASKTDDSQTLRMVAGALANLCGNERLHMMLKEDGGIKALLEMARSKNNDVVAQVARGIANFAKCESRGILQGHKKGRSLLMEDGALEWLIAYSNTTSVSTRRHVELALCHLAQNEDNVKDFISGGGVKELVRISVESSREDIRNLAKKTLKMNPTFQADIRWE